jgi:hypothetical protein
MLYIVVSYNSLHCFQGAKVVVNGIYDDLNTAIARQFFISDDELSPVYPKSKCMLGKNGIISWIKEVDMGDLDCIDIKRPDSTP